MTNELPTMNVVIPLADGGQAQAEYDQEGDLLEIYFQRGPAACTVFLTTNVVLRFDQERAEPLSLGFINYSYLVKPDEFGPRSFPLSKDLAHLPDGVRQAVTRIITGAPVNQFLKVITVEASAKRRFPVAYVDRSPAFAFAAA